MNEGAKRGNGRSKNRRGNEYRRNAGGDQERKIIGRKRQKLGIVSSERRRYPTWFIGGSAMIAFTTWPDWLRFRDLNPVSDSASTGVTTKSTTNCGTKTPDASQGCQRSSTLSTAFYLTSSNNPASVLHG
jgi:hypothetical protein